MIDRVYTLDEIRDIITPIAIRHGLSKVFLFGSYARNAANVGSDIDICVEAPNLRGLFALGGLYADLSDALDKNLDLVTAASLDRNPDTSFADNVRKDSVLLYERS